MRRRQIAIVTVRNQKVHVTVSVDIRQLKGSQTKGRRQFHDRLRFKAAAALIGEEDRPFAGGSYVAVQRYVHDLERWRRLDDREQEQIIGRTKRGSVELPKAKKPETAHISRVVIERDGAELQILRQSYPWGTVREAGLYFAAYTKSLDIFDLMLARMMGTTGDGLHDRLMEFTRAVTGATYFVPSLETLSSLKQ
jgi:putative iron-dependent peroxidase